MAFVLCKRPHQLIDFFSREDIPPPVTSTSLINLPVKKRFVELSLAIKDPVTTLSSFIPHSSLPMSRKLSPPKELVNADKSLRLQNWFTCEDAIAALGEEKVQKKKRAKRIKRRYVVRNHVTEQLKISCKDASTKQLKEPNKKKRKIERGQTVTNDVPEQLMICYHDSSATRHEEQNKKKRKIPAKIECGPVVENEVTERLKQFITSDEMKGSEMALVIQKVLYMSDLKRDQNRLNLPLKQLKTTEFLRADEKRVLENDEIEVRLVGPKLEMFKKPMRLKIWHMKRNKNFVLKTMWNDFVEDNKDDLKELSKIQLWSFRKDEQLCFALVVVERPDGANPVA